MGVAGATSVALCLVVLAGCTIPSGGTDDASDPFAGKYKPWLDFRGAEVIAQDIALAIENSTLVATVTLENLGTGTPGVDTESVTLGLTLQFYSRGWNNTAWAGSHEWYPFVIDRLPSHAEEAVFNLSRPHRWADAPHFGPLRPGDQAELRFLFPLSEEELNYLLFSFQLSGYYTGCFGEGHPETYSSWDAEVPACELTYDHCGYTWQLGELDLDGYYVPWEQVRHMECVTRPVEARYYGGPNDRGVPDTPRRFV